MADFTEMKLTNKGLELLAQVQTGGTLSFTGVWAGSGTLPSGTDITALEALITPETALPITRNEVTGAGQTRLRARLVSGAAAFYMREIGVFARINSGDPVLYAYANAGDRADYIPAASSATSIVQDIDLYTYIGNAANVTAEITAVIGVPPDDFDTHKNAAVLDHPDGSVTTAKIADGAVTSAKIAASILLGGTPTAPTAPSGTDTAQIATTAFVTAAIEAALANVLNDTYAVLYVDKNSYNIISDLTSATAKISYVEFQAGGGDYNTDVYKDIMYLTDTTGLPKSSGFPVFFRSMAWMTGDGSEAYNDQYLLYSNGTMYKRSRMIWRYDAMDGSFGDWETVTRYGIFSA